MKSYIKFFKVFIAGMLLVVSYWGSATAQVKDEYQRLAHRPNRQGIFFNFFSLPGNQGDSLQFVASYSINYGILTFKKVNPSERDSRFYSNISLNWEIFKAKKRRSKKDRIPIEGLEPAGRAFWEDTVYADTYEQTKSDKSFAKGFMTTHLEPGLYNYMLQLKRGGDMSEQNSRTRQVALTSYRDQKNGEAYLIQSVEKKDGSTHLLMGGFGDNVHYGKDFYALIHLPEYNSSSTYKLQVNRLNISQDDTSRGSIIYQKDITGDELHKNVRPVVINKKGTPELELQNDSQGFAFALVSIPNSTFPNAVYGLSVMKSDSQHPVSRSVFHSLWLDMPASLYNLDVAIDMLRFITDKNTIKNIKSGNYQEKERKFRQFWKAKDPTPKTEFNELMAEYYRRIDYAYEHFTTFNTVGYNSDRGKIYIQYGPPKSIKREFPPGQPAIEVWDYGSTEFLFKATSGFGDFKLVKS